MRRIATLCAGLLLAGCGGSGTRPAPRATTTTAVPVPPPVAPAPMLPATRGPWSALTPAAPEPPSCPSSSARLAVRNLAADRFSAGIGPLALGDGRMAMLRGGDAERAELAVYEPGGRILATAPLGSRHYAFFPPAMACTADGTLAVAWIEFHGDLHYRLRLVFVRPGGRPGPPLTVARRSVDADFYAGMSSVALAFAPDGALLVAIGELWRVRVVTVATDGTIGRPVVLGHASELANVVAEVAANGRAVVVWATQGGGEERNIVRRVYAAFREPGAAAFAPARRVHDPGATFTPMDSVNDPPSAVRLAVAPNGRALLEWGTVSGHLIWAKHPVRVVEAPPHGRFGRSRRLTADGIPGDVALRPDGAAIATWLSNHRVRATVHARGARFRRVETLAALQGRFERQAATFDARGRPRVAWTNGPIYSATRRRP